MNLSKLALLSIISLSIASVSSAASLATKVDPAVTVPGANSSANRIRVLTTVKDSRAMMLWMDLAILLNVTHGLKLNRS